MRENMLLLGFIFYALAVFDPVLTQRSRCSDTELDRCSRSLTRSIGRRINDMSRSETTTHCIDVRNDFNCMLEQTRCVSSETERNRHGDVIRNGMQYIRTACDTNGGSWRDSTCFVGDSMKTCESSYPLGGVQYASYSAETCKKFNLFQDCVADIVRKRCRPEDERLLGQYLVDTAQDLAWNCGESASSTSSSMWDRSRDDRYDRDRYDSRDRDRGTEWDRDRGRDSSYRDRDRDRGLSSDRDRDRGLSGDRDRDRGLTGSRDRDRDRGLSGSRDRDWDRGSSMDRYDRNGDDRGYGGNDATCCRNERCSSSRMQQCRDSLSRIVDTRSSGYQDSQKCRKMRDDFNCLLWQTSNCMGRNERDRDNDLFRRARDFISRNCDTYGRWSENSCFKSSEMQRCEHTLTNPRGGANYENCRSYMNFRDCMQDELRRRCTREDELYQGAYLTDKAQELSWQCGEEISNNGKNQYYTDNRDNRRDPYDSGYDRDRYDSPEHLEDDDAMCLSRIQGYNDQCKATLDEKRREIYVTNEYEARQRINCCSARQYRSCLYDATRRICQSDRSRVVDSLMGRYTHELSSDNCRKIYDYDCDGAVYHQISMILLLVCTTAISLLFNSHL